MGAIKISYDDILSLLTLDQIIEKNEVVKEAEEILIDQMSIYEFLDE